MKVKYKKYWRKSGLKGKWGDLLLELVAKRKPKTFLEIGVFCGVTARNVCELLNQINQSEFKYIGIDLFGEKSKNQALEKAPEYLKDQKFSNPLKSFFYNFLLRENLNSYQSVSNFLRKFEKQVKLIKGDTNIVLKNEDLKNVDYAFIDGGHSYETVKNDLNTLFSNMDKNKILLCDDYFHTKYITEVRKAVDDFVKQHNLQFNIIENRFAEIIT